MKRRKILFTVAVCAIVGTVLSVNAQDQSESRYKYYTNVEIAEGDTLWDYAEEYRTYEYKSNQQYIDEVCKLNGLVTYQIKAGNWLILPYYSSEYK